MLIKNPYSFFLTRSFSLSCPLLSLVTKPRRFSNPGWPHAFYADLFPNHLGRHRDVLHRMLSHGSTSSSPASSSGRCARGTTPLYCIFASYSPTAFCDCLGSTARRPRWAGGGSKAWVANISSHETRTMHRPSSCASSLPCGAFVSHALALFMVASLSCRRSSSSGSSFSLISLLLPRSCTTSNNYSPPGAPRPFPRGALLTSVATSGPLCCETIGCRRTL